MKFRSILAIPLLIATVFLTSCAAVGGYTPPGRNEPSAMLRGSNVRHSLTNWMHTDVKRIDGKLAAMVMSSSHPVHIHPGKHNVIVYIEYNDAFFSGGPFETMNEVSFTAAANQDYVVKSSASKGRVYSWVETKSGKVVSNKTSSLAKVQTRPVYIYVSR